MLRGPGLSQRNRLSERDRRKLGDHDWSLYWRDRNLRFHKYDLIAPSRRVDELLAEIDRDPHRSSEVR
jgi:hypothetical protein